MTHQKVHNTKPNNLTKLNQPTTESSIKDGSFSTHERSTKPVHIISIDHGFGLTKTVNCCFPSGIVPYDNEPFTSKDVLKLDKKYYICGSGRQGLTKDKTEDESYFIITLAAIAKEIDFRKLNRECDIIIAAGLPLTSFGREKASFKKYLMPLSPIRFEYENRKYKINIIDVHLFPQGYSAVAFSPDILKKEPSQILVDIGSWTVDCMMINNSIPDAASCRSLELGMIRCIEETQEEIRRKTGLSVTPAQIEQVLLRKECSIDNRVKDIILTQGSKYSQRLFKTLTESGFDTRAVPTIIMGGGANVVKNYVEKPQQISILNDINANAKGYEIFAKKAIENVKG